MLGSLRMAEDVETDVDADWVDGETLDNGDNGSVEISSGKGPIEQVEQVEQEAKNMTESHWRP